MVEVAGCRWRTAAGMHSQRALALRLDDAENSLFYSGDGRPTPATEKLATGSDLVVHEAFRLGGETPGHGSIQGCLDFAAKTGVPNLALLHIQREERLFSRNEIEVCLKQHSSSGKVWMPEPGVCFTL